MCDTMAEFVSSSIAIEQIDWRVCLFRQLESTYKQSVRRYVYLSSFSLWFLDLTGNKLLVGKGY